MKVLVTGATGFVGSHMVDFLLENCPEVEIHGTKRYHLSRVDKIQHVYDRIVWHDINLLEASAVSRLIQELRPDVVFHFAAESFVSPSWSHPTVYMRSNFDLTVNLLEAIKNYSPETVIHIPGSGEEYGDVAEGDLPITNSTVLNPVNPYAVTKISQDLIAYVYFRSYGVRVVRTRAFNHEGPRRENVFGIPWYAFQIARIEKGLSAPELKVGTISDKRNFTHVRDMVRAYWLASQKCEYGKLYLVGNPSVSSVYTFEDAIKRLLEVSEVQDVTVSVDSRYVRPTAVPFLIADVSEFQAVSGWAPVLSFDDILLDTLNYWRDVIEANPHYAKISAL